MVGLTEGKSHPGLTSVLNWWWERVSAKIPAHRREIDKSSFSNRMLERIRTH